MPPAFRLCSVAMVSIALQAATVAVNGGTAGMDAHADSVVMSIVTLVFVAAPNSVIMDRTCYSSIAAARSMSDYRST